MDTALMVKSFIEQMGEEEAEKVGLQVLREKAALTGGIRGHLQGKLIVCFVLGVIHSFVLRTLLNEEVRRHITLVQVLRGRKQTSHPQEVTTGSIAPAAHKVFTVIVFNIVTFSRLLARLSTRSFIAISTEKLESITPRLESS